MIKPVLVLCLGSEVGTDDAFGPWVAKRLKGDDFGDQAEVLYSPIAGFQILDLVSGRKRVLIVDAMQSGAVPPGSVRLFPAALLTPEHNLTTSHQVSVLTALELGPKLGLPMPERVDILAVEAEDVKTMSTELTLTVAAAMGEALTRVREWVRDQLPIAGKL